LGNSDKGRMRALCSRTPRHGYGFTWVIGCMAQKTLGPPVPNCQSLDCERGNGTNCWAIAAVNNRNTAPGSPRRVRVSGWKRRQAIILGNAACKPIGSLLPLTQGSSIVPPNQRTAVISRSQMSSPEPSAPHGPRNRISILIT